MEQIIEWNSTCRGRETSGCELRDAVRSKFFPRDILVQSEMGKRESGKKGKS